jgi:hypothetical protein
LTHNISFIMILSYLYFVYDYVFIIKIIKFSSEKQTLFRIELHVVLICGCCQNILIPVIEFKYYSGLVIHYKFI